MCSSVPLSQTISKMPLRSSSSASLFSSANFRARGSSLSRMRARSWASGSRKRSNTGPSRRRMAVALRQILQRAPVRRRQIARQVLDAPADIHPARRLDIDPAIGAVPEHAYQPTVLRPGGDAEPAAGLTDRVGADQRAECFGHALIAMDATFERHLLDHRQMPAELALQATGLVGKLIATHHQGRAHVDQRLVSLTQILVLDLAARRRGHVTSFREHRRQVLVGALPQAMIPMLVGHRSSQDQMPEECWTKPATGISCGRYPLTLGHPVDLKNQGTAANRPLLRHLPLMAGRHQFHLAPALTRGSV